MRRAAAPAASCARAPPPGAASALTSAPGKLTRRRLPAPPPPRSDWDNVSTHPGSLGDASKPNALACETVLFEFLCCIRNYLKHESGFESYAEFVLDARGDSVWTSFFGDSNLRMKKKTVRAATQSGGVLPACGAATFEGKRPASPF